MRLNRIRRTVALTALACTLALAVPAHAAGWQSLGESPGWFQKAVEWIAGVWAENDATGSKAPSPRAEKGGYGTDPDGTPAVTPPATDPDS
ncbi:MAG TPA: hypothetical protein VGX68_13780 [Thermoanaerobaculia bacterium]|jgi:hypothetical protein|nr:hypothetical protein [Thermoanaerobaculia bacterium]